LENQLGPPNSTGPIRESEAIPKKYFANFGFDFGIPLISHKPIETGRESQIARLSRRILVGFGTGNVGYVKSEKILFVYSAWGPN
jgi:hypothetical protein